ncbi:MAG TPA: nucleotidyltransferase family protein, partial [Longimicrobiaceae bacterium]|nr:nucleotidyltransferase family protein [Longimicrobiaceae bacterium]
MRPQSQRESEWLLGLLRDPPDGALSERLAHLTEAEWDRLAAEALRHYAAPLLYHRLRRVAPALPAVRGIEALRHEYVQNALRNIRVYAALSEVVSALEAARIPVIALKGAHLAAVVYGEPALRPMHDLDLLVRREDRSRAEDRLLQLGYRPMEYAREWTDYDAHHHSRPLFRDGATTVEIHSAIVPPTCPIRIDLEGLWGRARYAQLGDVRTLVLGPEDLILHLCLHASYSHHFQIPLLSLYDIAAVLRHHSKEIDWPRLVSMADASGTGPVVYCTLRLVQATLGAELDAPSFESFVHDGTAEGVTDAILDEILSTPVEVPTGVHSVVGEERWDRRLHILLRTIFP